VNTLYFKTYRYRNLDKNIEEDHPPRKFRIEMRNSTYPFTISLILILITFGVFYVMSENFSSTLSLFRENPVQYGVISFIIIAGTTFIPLPSSILLYLNGFFVGVLGGTALSLIALMTGSVAGYYVGKSELNLRHFENSQTADQLLSTYGMSSIFLTRGVPVLSEIMCFRAGYHRIDFVRYLVLSLIGHLPLCLLHAIFGVMGNVGEEIFVVSFVCSIGLSVALWYFGKNILPQNDLIP